MSPLSLLSREIPQDLKITELFTTNQNIMSYQPLTLGDVIEKYAAPFNAELDQEAIETRPQQLRIIEADQRFRRLDMGFMRETHKQGRLLVPSFAMFAEADYRLVCYLTVQAAWDKFPFTKDAVLYEWRSLEFVEALDKGVVDSLKTATSRRLGFFESYASVSIDINFTGTLPEHLQAMLNQTKWSGDGSSSLDFDEVFIVGEAPKWRTNLESYPEAGTTEGLHLLIGRIGKTYWLITTFDSRASSHLDNDDFGVAEEN